LQTSEAERQVNEFQSYPTPMKIAMGSTGSPSFQHEMTSMYSSATRGLLPAQDLPEFFRRDEKVELES